MKKSAARTGETDIIKIREKIDRVFSEQQANRLKVANVTAHERIKKLKSLLKLVDAYREDLHQAHYKDFKKPVPEVELSEIYTVRTEIKHAVKHLKKWMKPRKVKPTLPMLTTSSQIRYKPKGMVLIISPWNFPFNLTFGPLASAIAAGNCVMLKPSEFTPATSRIMKKMVDEHFSENEVSLFEGDKTVASELLKKPFNHIFFTGSPDVGSIVMKAAAERHATVTLELGGKSPVIVDETANVGDAAEKIAWGKFLNNGQTCIAPDHLYVHESSYDEFITKLKENIQKFYGDSEESRKTSPDYARIISDRHFARLEKIIKDSQKKGAKLEFGGAADPDDRYIEPTVLANVDEKSPAMKEEIFGPVLPVLRYRDLTDVLERINSRENPLALYIFSKRKKNVEKILSNTAAGGSCINQVLIHYMHVNLPFGGINNSGFGNSHGVFGFRAFSHEQAILKEGRVSAVKLLQPPYTVSAKKIIKLFVKYL